MALVEYKMGTQYIENGVTKNIKGVDFNPYIPANSVSDLAGIISNGGTISLSGLQYGHEVIMCLGAWDDNDIHFIQYRKGSNSLFSNTFSDQGYFVYIGIDYDEIISNGTDYYIDFGRMQYSSNEGYYSLVQANNNYCYTYLSPIFDANVNIGDEIYIEYYDWVNFSSVVSKGVNKTVIINNKTITTNGYNYYWDASIYGNNPSALPNSGLLCFMYKGKQTQATLNYQITNFPTVVGPVNSGHIWVEGNNLCYIDAVLNTTGYKHIIKHDGTIYSTGKNPGMFWVDTTNHGKLCYIDASGNERKTYKGDINGRQGGNEPAISGKTPGMMRVSSSEGNYGYVSFIGYDGNRYRIMNGPV